MPSDLFHRISPLPPTSEPAESEQTCTGESPTLPFGSGPLPLDRDDCREIYDRETAVPALSAEGFAAQVIKAAEAAESAAKEEASRYGPKTVPRPAAATLPPLTLDLSSDVPPHPRSPQGSRGTALGVELEAAPPGGIAGAETAPPARDPEASSVIPIASSASIPLPKLSPLPSPYLEAGGDQWPALGALDFVDTHAHAPLANAPQGAPLSSPPPPGEGSSPKEMQDRYQLGDFTGALVIAEMLLDANPEDPDAKRYSQSCREVLTQMYAARLGPLDQVAAIAVSPDQIRWLSLDHRAGFLLSLVDGMSTVEEILDISGMPRLDALRIMYTLTQQKVVTLS